MNINNFNLGNNFKAQEMNQQNGLENKDVKVEKKVEVKEEPVQESAFKDKNGVWHVIYDDSDKVYRWDANKGSYVESKDQRYQMQDLDIRVYDVNTKKTIERDINTGRRH